MLGFLWSKPSDDGALDAEPNELDALNPRPLPERTERIGINVLDDGNYQMTLGRRLALQLMNRKWYNPLAGSPSTRSDDRRRPSFLSRPSLKKAWAYFEHFALNRYVVGAQGEDRKHQKAEPGENCLRTRLYDPLCTPHADLGDFGLGVGLYFSILRFVSFLTLLCGLVSLGNIFFFDSDEYQPQEFREQLPFALRGSAICSRTNWVPCASCDCVPEGVRLTAEELKASLYLPIDRCMRVGNATFALRNECGEIPIYVGMTHLATIFIFVVALFSFGTVMKWETVYFDENEQTAQDYSIRISNPPRSANNPDEWHNFFKFKFDVNPVVVTCSLDNDLLIRTLVERRECFRKIELLVDANESVDDANLAKMAAQIERERSPIEDFKASLYPGIPELYARLVALNAKVKGLAQLDYSVTNVFLTFETEDDQRRVLQELSVGFWQAHLNDRKALATPEHLFRNEHVLYVSEPDEPSTIRWEDLNVSLLQWSKRIVASHIITVIGIVIALFIVRYADRHFSSVKVVSYTISALNSLFPMFATALTELEQHPSAGYVQTSLFLKIAVFRWVNTAFVLTMITPFTATLADDEHDGIIYKVYLLFWSEIVTTTILQLADISGHINRHFLAPRAKTQDAMNLQFQGAFWSLAERYTNMTMFLLLCVWYCSLFPAAFFLCSISLGLKYYLDRFSLMRTWKRAPHYGTRVARTSHQYFFPLMVVAMTVMGTLYWSGFPYDNICPAVDDSSGEYRYCYENFHNTAPSHEWMTGNQQMIEKAFEAASYLIIVAVLCKFLWDMINSSRALFASVYKPFGKDQNIPFSSLSIRSGYIPGVVSPLFSFPLLACRSEEIDEVLFDWKDPDHPYSYYDLSDDADELLQDSGLSRKGFSSIKCFPSERSNRENYEKFA